MDGFTQAAVGVDGSEPSIQAARWAVRAAALRGLGLTVVTAYGLAANAPAPDAEPEAARRERAEKASAAVVEALGPLARKHDVELTPLLVDAAPAQALIKVSEDVDLIVVGAIGQGGFAGRKLGSISSSLPGLTLCPLVVLRTGDTGPSAAEDEFGVVVGTDSSEYSGVTALEAALYASEWQRPLRLVCATKNVPDENKARAQVDADAAWLAGHFPDLEIITECHDEEPIGLLTRLSGKADMVAVGARGRGAFASLRFQLGRVTTGVLHHAQGSIMVVPFRDDPRLANRTTDA